MYFKKRIIEKGCFEQDQNSNEWTFQPWEGDSFDIVNRDIVPVDTYSDYQISGVLSKGCDRKMKITKVSKVQDDWSPEFNTVYWM